MRETWWEPPTFTAITDEIRPSGSIFGGYWWLVLEGALVVGEGTAFTAAGARRAVQRARRRLEQKQARREVQEEELEALEVRCLLVVRGARGAECQRVAFHAGRCRA